MRLVTPSLPVLALLPLLACAPTRDDDPDPDPTPVNDFDTALFTIVDHGDGATTQDASLVLVDLDIGCEDLDWSGDLMVWSLPQGVSWVRTFITHGVALDGWLRQYESYTQAQQSGTSAGDQVSLFWGEVGEGPLEDDVPIGGPEDDPMGSRDLVASLGVGSGGMDDVLDVSVSTDALLAGTIESAVGDWSFAATKCGVVSDEGDGADPDQPPAADDGGDSGGSGGSSGSP